MQVEDYSFNWGYFDEDTGLCAGSTRALPLFPALTDSWLSRLQDVRTPLCGAFLGVHQHSSQTIYVSPHACLRTLQGMMLHLDDMSRAAF